MRGTISLKYEMRAIRMVQYNPVSLSLSLRRGDGGALRGDASPVDTHLFLHGGEPDHVMHHVMQKPLVMGGRRATCAPRRRRRWRPSVELRFNGQSLALE